jgi:hypothetical protein
MDITEIIVAVVGIVFTGGVVTAVLTFISARVKNRSDGLVAARTVDLQVDALALGNDAQGYKNLLARIELIDAANKQERESLSNTIVNVRRDLTDARERIVQLESDRQRDGERMSLLSRNHRIAIAYIKVLLAHINDATPAHLAPPVPAELELDFNS